jgi:mono/diheme cytochrome c family protein
MRWLTVLAAAAIAALCAGCGDSHSARATVGRELFARACGACHTLSGVDSASHQGGDLLRAQLSRPVLLQFTREMPVHPPLTERQTEAVADYILAVQRSGR